MSYCVAPEDAFQVKTRVLSSLTDPKMPLADEMHSGTLITFEEDENMEKAVISGIAFQRDEAQKERDRMLAGLSI